MKAVASSLPRPVHIYCSVLDEVHRWGSYPWSQHGCCHDEAWAIMTMTSIQPRKIRGYPNSMIDRTGRINVEQTWTNGELNNYLFVVRPNELDKLRPKTEAQAAQVERALEKNKDRIDRTTMTMHVIKSDVEKKALDISLQLTP